MGRRGTHIQGAVKNLAMAAGMAAAAARDRCAAPPGAKKQLYFHRYTPISVIYPAPLYRISFPVCLPFSSLLSPFNLVTPSFNPHWAWVLHPYLMLSFAELHICSRILFYCHLQFPLRTHAAFVTVPDKLHPALRSQIQVVITFSLKWRLLS